MNKFSYGQEIHGTVLAIGDTLADADEPLRFVTARLRDGPEVEVYLSGDIALSPGQSFRAKAGHSIYRPRGKAADREMHVPELLDVMLEFDAPQVAVPKRKRAIFSRLFDRCR
jgi:hypothetical protein